MPEVGIEPTCPCERGILSPLRLPVSPLRHGADYYDGAGKCQDKCIDKASVPVLEVQHLSENQACGVVAQLGERLNGIQEAASSILASSTRNKKGLSCVLAPSLFLAFWIAPLITGKCIGTVTSRKFVSARRKCAPIPGADCKCMSSAKEHNRTCVTALRRPLPPHHFANLWFAT